MKTYKVQVFPKRTPAYDSRDVKIGARGLGYLGDDGDIGLLKCPECGAENCGICVSSGACGFCGFDANPVVKEALEHVSE